MLKKKKNIKTKAPQVDSKEGCIPEYKGMVSKSG